MLSLNYPGMFCHRLWILIVAFAACIATPKAVAVELEPVAEGLDKPISVSHAGDGSGRLFINEQAGRIVIYDRDEGKLLDTPFLDISALSSCCGERGLLDIAFHPDYENNGLLYVNYTDTNGDTVIARYSVSNDENAADPNSAETLLTFAQPYPNHNGGELAFGPDGYLYIATGDGGAGSDPHNNGQSLDTLLGKLLRIDVDGDPYAIPADNPFADVEGARAEIWAYGLRNPWRFSFDRETGDVFIADVGQRKWEEINFQPAGSDGGENYGWRHMEGAHCFKPPQDCNQEDLVLPIVEYDHSQGCSVTGGYMYRGDEIDALEDTYVFGDYCSGTLWGATGEGENWTSEILLSTDIAVTSFGEDEAGELYLIGYDDGRLYRFVE